MSDPKTLKRSEYSTFRSEAIVDFEKQLEEFRQRKLLKPKQIEDMKAGFSDGMSALFQFMVQNELIRVED